MDDRPSIGTGYTFDFDAAVKRLTGLGHPNPHGRSRSQGWKRRFVRYRQLFAARNASSGVPAWTGLMASDRLGRQSLGW
jgi:hypothetical protein